MEVSSPRVLLKDQAYEEIKKRILDGRIVPGAFLAERALAIELGMSKTPIRAAIGRLESEGFVAVAPQQGIVVREISMDEVVDLFDIRIALETFVARRLAGRLSDRQYERLRESLSLQEKAAQNSDATSYIQLDAGFHRLLADFSGNAEIVRVMNRQQDMLHRIIYKVLHYEPERMVSSTEEHSRVVEAIWSGDGDLAASAMNAHLIYGKQAMVSR